MVLLFILIAQTSPSEEPLENGEYVAPLKQETQPTYVPQSVALSGPKVITTWDETQPIPPGYHPVRRVSKGLVAGGASLFGSIYLITVLAGAITVDVCKLSSSCTPSYALFIPVVGPLFEIPRSASMVGDLFLVLDTLAQGAGVFMFIFGLAAPRVVLVRNDLAYAPTVEPYFAGSGGGMRVSF